MAQDTGKYRDTKDQFYTSPAVAKKCVQLLQKVAPRSENWIEPAAGTGVFLGLVSNAIGYDIEPKHPKVQKANFLEVQLPEQCVVFGNPPFGRQSSLAKQFIRHAATKASFIGFILPRSFCKPSMQACFPDTFHLIHEHELPSNAFVVNDLPYNVPCVFQIWKRMDTPRVKKPAEEPIGFQFVKKPETHHVVFRRVGGTAGTCSAPADQAIQSHYFIRLDNPATAIAIIEKSQSHVFPSNTTGPRSLSKPEAIEFLNSCTRG